MMERFKDREHLFRMGALFLGALALFMVLRAVFVPKGFGTYGHYREGALHDMASRPLHYAGRHACEECHSDIADARKGSKHEKVACEACHGPLAEHAADPDKLKPTKPDAVKLCPVCHTENVAKPKGFPQVDPKDHGEGKPCGSCHKPHHPEIA
jgi:hypothetical protein